MKLEFTKMEGCGNDYLYVNGFTQQIPEEKKPGLVRRLSDRHFGVGGDGVIFINPAPDGIDFEMEMYNADGSRGEMCGNGIRCVAKYVSDHGMTDRDEISVVSAGAVKYLTLYKDAEGLVETVRVNMGAPVLHAAQIPVDLKPAADHAGQAGAEDVPEDAVIGERIEVAGRSYEITCVSMGNPHAVVFVHDLEHYPVKDEGPLFECHWRFPKRINTEFVEVHDRKHISMRVWERGAGETLACGTGCCASVVACVLNGLTEEEVMVHVLGGELLIRWDREKNVVWMTGPAKTVFTGFVEV